MAGSGTASDPYIISDVDDLQAIENDLTAYYELGGDIDASATSGWNAGAGFVPISSFTGNFDGKGYTISDLTIARATTNYVGLFGQVDTSLEIKNVTVTGIMEGQNYVGGLIGLLRDGTVDNCVSSVNVTGDNHDIGGLIGDAWSSSTVKDSSATGSVTATASSGGLVVGGFIGKLECDVDRCFATGNVSTAGTEDDVGGFAGEVNTAATVNDCYARGTVSGDDDVGGFVGDNKGTCEDCYSTGAATGNTDVGGFCGNNSGTITNCFWDTETSSNAASDGGTGKTTAEMKTQSTFTGAGWNFATIWHMNGVTNNAYPFLFAGAVSPSDAVARVSSIRHIFRPGFFRMQVGLGDLGLDIDVAETAVRAELDTARDSFKERMDRTAKQLEKEAGMSREESLRMARKLETMEEAAREPIGPREETYIEKYTRLYGKHPGFIGAAEAPAEAPEELKPPVTPEEEAQIIKDIGRRLWRKLRGQQ